ncbi:hypothetical protein L1987_38579 [Smallanthus sonchifolius]|uniref:Uncharacterized protein n=1 Tax=Smallanthus sonchifolius TaxID=185202 RepID=A0ACB9HKS8_9ASTR|nr:hypothetical protein L1987_38579 [Smallanthus sonchifolius]
MPNLHATNERSSHNINRHHIRPRKHRNMVVHMQTTTTCPATKQPFSATDLILNHTLRRLINSWYSLNSHHNFDLIPTPNKPQNQITCLRSMRSVARTCMEDNLGVFEFVKRVIMEENEADFVTEACDEALMVVHHLKITDLMIQKGVVGNEVKLLNALLHVMRFGSVESRSRAITFLRSVFKVMDPGYVNPELFNQTVRMLKDNVSHSQQTIKSLLEVVVETVRCGRNRVKAAESGIVWVLVDRLIEILDRRACELMLVALEQICRCAEGRAKLVEHAAGLATISKKILRVSHVGSDRAVRILGLVCRFCGSCGVVQEMVEVGVVSKLCLMIQIDYSDRIKKRVKEILMLHSRVWKDASCVPAHLLSSYPSS